MNKNIRMLKSRLNDGNKLGDIVWNAFIWPGRVEDVLKSIGINLGLCDFNLSFRLCLTVYPIHGIVIASNLIALYEIA